MFNGKVDTEALRCDLELLGSESERLEPLRSETLRAMARSLLLTRKPKTETMRTRVSAES